jgi:hypothetical protein
MHSRLEEESHLSTILKDDGRAIKAHRVIAMRSLVSRSAENIIQPSRPSTILPSTMLSSTLLLFLLAPLIVYGQTFESVCQGISDLGGCTAKVNIPTGEVSVKNCEKDFFNVSR